MGIFFFVKNKASFLQCNGIVCVCGKHKEYASFIAVRCSPGLCLVEFGWVPVKCIWDPNIAWFNKEIQKSDQSKHTHLTLIVLMEEILSAAVFVMS